MRYCPHRHWPAHCSPLSQLQSLGSSMQEWMNAHRYESDSVNLSPVDGGEGLITTLKVEAVLRGLDVGAASGLDGLSYGFWRNLDPKGKLLADLFEVCRSSCRIPKQWRSSRITLFCKNLRVICAMSRTVDRSPSAEIFTRFMRLY